jgi:hypothetical protein
MSVIKVFRVVSNIFSSIMALQFTFCLNCKVTVQHLKWINRVIKKYFILADPQRCPGILAALKPENMHLLYVSLEITVLATIEVIRLVIQIPLRTKRWTYLIYAPVPLYLRYLFSQSSISQENK